MRLGRFMRIRREGEGGKVEDLDTVVACGGCG